MPGNAQLVAKLLESHAEQLCIGGSSGSSLRGRLRAQVLLETNTAGNLQLVVQVAKEYTEQLGAGKIMELLESHKSYHGLYYYLGGHIAFSEDPEVRHCTPKADELASE